MLPGVITTLAIFSFGAVAIGLGLGVMLLTARGRANLVDLIADRSRHPIGWGLLASGLATLGSLYLSDVAHLAPCVLCWYQRIAMYPLVPILGVAFLRADLAVWRYSLPLAIVGLAISSYHVTLEWNPDVDVGLCGVGPPCSARYFAVFGFVSIPTMAGAAFLMIISIMVLLRTLESAGAKVPRDAT
jgi:disulfide bond formation protein DsbB